MNADNLAEEVATYARVQAKEVITEIIPKLDAIVEHVDKEEPKIDVHERMVIKEEVISEVVDEIQEKIEIKPETEIIEDLEKIKMEEIKEEIPMTDVAESKAEKPVITVVLPEEIKKTIEVEPTEEEPISLDSDKPDIVSEKLKEDEIMMIPEEKILEESTEIPMKEVLIDYDKLGLTKKLEKIEKDIVVQKEIQEIDQSEEETKIILPIQKLSDEEEEIFIPEKEEIKHADGVEKGIIEESIDSKEIIDEIKVEQVIPIEMKKTDIEDEILEKTKDENDTEVGRISKEELETEVKSKIEIKEKTADEKSLVKLEVKEVTDVEEIFVDAETKELPEISLPTPLTKDIQETIEFKEKIPPIEVDVERIEVPKKVIAEKKFEKMEMKVLEEKPIKIEVKEIEKEEMLLEEEMPILRKVPEIKEEIEEISDKFHVIEPLPISVKEEKIKEKPKTPIDPRIVAKPYLAVADIEVIEKESFLDVLIAKDLPCVCKKSEEIKLPAVLSAMQIVITQTEIVQTIINRGTQTSTVYPIKLKITDQKSTETGGDPEISEKKMRWRKRPKNRSAVLNLNVSSQTDKPLLVLRGTTQEPNLNKKQRLLSDILRSLKSDINTEEKEIRSINYNNKINEIYKCDCCVCGNNNSSPKISTTVRSRPKFVNTKIPNMDQNMQDEKSSYRTLKSNIKEKLQTCNFCAPNVSKFSKLVCDQEMCTCSASSSKIKVGINSKRKYKSEKKDQSCLAKIPKRKIRSKERKKDDEMESITCQGKCVKCEENKIKERKYHKDLDDSPSNCICTKIERTESGRLWKREICGCDDYD
ncbi:hypothetical protein M0804_006813 [Polistes exclamans]|nr:hypothetical protein M0804_006813 [Polistes exclamans]